MSPKPQKLKTRKCFVEIHLDRFTFKNVNSLQNKRVSSSMLYLMQFSFEGNCQSIRLFYFFHYIEQRNYYFIQNKL